MARWGLLAAGLLASTSSAVNAQSYGTDTGSSLPSAASSVGSGAASSAASSGASLGLHNLAVAAGKRFFGTATDTNLFNDTAYMQVVNDASEFGILVPENSQKWQPTEPQQDSFVFGSPDRVRTLAQTNRQQFRCHTLTWFQQLPQFITTTAWTRQTLTAAIQAHIANVVGHYRGQCYSWDVVNEALNDNGTFRDSVFFQVLGTDFLPISFAAAAAADPGARLYYNDFNLEFGGNKTQAALAIVRLVQQAGLRIDGVGFQAHMTVGQTPARAAMAGVLRQFTRLGLEVALTELDVRQPSLPPSTALVQQQATDYASMVGACVDVGAACVGVVAWEYTDRYSWIPSTFPGTGAACLFDENLVRKPAYTAVASVLASAAGVALPSSTAAAAAGVGGTSSGTNSSSSSNSDGSTGGLNGLNGTAGGSSTSSASSGTPGTPGTPASPASPASSPQTSPGSAFVGSFGGSSGSVPEADGSFGGSAGSIPAADAGSSSDALAAATEMQSPDSAGSTASTPDSMADMSTTDMSSSASGASSASSSTAGSSGGIVAADSVATSGGCAWSPGLSGFSRFSGFFVGLAGLPTLSDQGAVAVLAAAVGVLLL